MTVQFSAIYATDEKGGMGLDNKLPWPKCREDMAWYRRHTVGKRVVMGYRTWKSLPHEAFNDRQNVVLSSKPIPAVHHLSKCGQEFAGTYWCKPEEFEQYIPKAWDGFEVLIIGGAITIKDLSHLISRVYLTTFKGEFESDAFITDNTEDWDMVYFDDFSSKVAKFQIFEGEDLEVKIDVSKLVIKLAKQLHEEANV